MARLRPLAATVAIVLATAGCGHGDPLAGLGGDGLAERCRDGLPSPEGTVVNAACNDGQGRVESPIGLEPGSYELIALCDGADGVTVVINPEQPMFEKAEAMCGGGSDPARVPIGQVKDPTGGMIAITQLGEGDAAWFVVRR